MGRDWIRAFSLDKEPLSAKEPAVGDVNAIQEMDKAVKSVIDRYPEVFAPGLGHCKKMKARLVLKENARPPFIKARPVPYAMSPELEKELDRWQSLGIISPIPHSDCAAPLVIVRKPNGSLRLCADFSTGLNAALKIDQYPLPKPTDLFTKLNGAKYFTKIDFSEAYLQIEVDDAAKKLLVINTPKGLFAFNRLPFGVASAPAIFQQEMEKMLQGIKDVAVYLDDILVVSKTKEGHLRTLDKLPTNIRGVSGIRGRRTGPSRFAEEDRGHRQNASSREYLPTAFTARDDQPLRAVPTATVRSSSANEPPASRPPIIEAPEVLRRSTRIVKTPVRLIENMDASKKSYD